MKRAKRMCRTCPWPHMTDAEKHEMATGVDPDGWPCHTVDPYGDEGVQCRGHWEARRKFSDSTAGDDR